MWVCELAMDNLKIMVVHCKQRSPAARLVKETKAHVLIRLLLLLFFLGLLLFLGRSSSATSSRGTSRCCYSSAPSARRNGCQFGWALRDQLFKGLVSWEDSLTEKGIPKASPKTYIVQIFAVELSKEFTKTTIVGIDPDGVQNMLYVLGRGGVVSAEAEEQVSSKVLHDLWLARVRMVQTWFEELEANEGASHL